LVESGVGEHREKEVPDETQAGVSRKGERHPGG
jgi:hypothetical protein